MSKPSTPSLTTTMMPILSRPLPNAGFLSESLIHYLSKSCVTVVLPGRTCQRCLPAMSLNMPLVTQPSYLTFMKTSYETSRGLILIELLDGNAN